MQTQNNPILNEESNPILNEADRFFGSRTLSEFSNLPNDIRTPNLAQKITTTQNKVTTQKQTSDTVLYVHDTIKQRNNKTRKRKSEQHKSCFESSKFSLLQCTVQAAIPQLTPQKNSSNKQTNKQHNQHCNDAPLFSLLEETRRRRFLGRRMRGQLCRRFIVRRNCRVQCPETPSQPPPPRALECHQGQNCRRFAIYAPGCLYAHRSHGST